LADLARAAADKEDTNERLAVARQSLSAAARSRSTGEAMSQVAAASHAPSRPLVEETPLPKPAPAREAPPTPSSRVHAEQTPVPRKRRRAPVFFYGLVTVVAVLAVAGFYLHRIQHPLIGKLAAMVGVSLAAPAPAPAPVVSVVEVVAPAASGSAQAKAAEPPAAEEGAAAEEEPEAATPGAPRRRVAGRLAPKGKEEPAKAEAEAKKPAEEAKPAEPAKAKEVGSLASEIEKRSQKEKDKKAEAEAAKESAPAKPEGPLEPSMGDVSSAMARVKPAATACLNGQPSNATVTASVTFSSDGRVASVAVSGPGAAAAGGCVKSALSGARVSPFSKPSFSISTTIRPVVRAASD
jgi:hypothetical protein